MALSARRLCESTALSGNNKYLELIFPHLRTIHAHERVKYTPYTCALVQEKLITSRDCFPFDSTRTRTKEEPSRRRYTREGLRTRARDTPNPLFGPQRSPPAHISMTSCVSPPPPTSRPRHLFGRVTNAPRTPNDGSCGGASFSIGRVRMLLSVACAPAPPNPKPTLDILCLPFSFPFFLYCGDI